jgi:hypothetical protein
MCQYEEFEYYFWGGGDSLDLYENLDNQVFKTLGSGRGKLDHIAKELDWKIAILDSTRIALTVVYR